MVNSFRPCERLQTLLLLLIVSLGAAACKENPSGQAPDEFPTKLYAISFEAPGFQAGRFAGQDEWFAALGSEAASIISRNTRVPKDGSNSLQVDGSRLEEKQGYFFGSYARPLNFAPLDSGMPRVVVEGWFALEGDDGPTCGCGLGLTGTLNGDPVPNILIGIQGRDSGYVSYLSNYDDNKVYGPVYNAGDWIHLRAVLDYERRTVHGYVNGETIGEVPFTKGIGDQVMFMNVSLGSNKPIPGVISYFDGVSVSAGPRR